MGCSGVWVKLKIIWTWKSCVKHPLNCQIFDRSDFHNFYTINCGGPEVGERFDWSIFWYRFDLLIVSVNTIGQCKVLIFVSTTVSVHFKFQLFHRPILFLVFKFRFLYRAIVSASFKFRFLYCGIVLASFQFRFLYRAIVSATFK